MGAWARQAVGGMLLLILTARLMLGAGQISMTADEPSHLVSGYTALARGLEGLWTVPLRGHTVGVDAWLALPLWLDQPDLPLEDLAGWKANYAAFFGDAWARFEAPQKALFSARIYAVFLTLLLAAVVWRWGRDLWGPWAGLLALGVLAFDPTLIAHGRLANNDMGVTAFGTWALYSIWRWVKRPSWRSAVAAGILLGLTMLAKSSGVLWMAAGGAVMLLSAARRRRQICRGRLLAQAALTGLLSLLLLWAAYGFSWGALGESGLYLPADVYWEGVLHHPQITGQRLVFALGRRTYGRWWWYFPLTFCLKNPLPLLIALVLGLGVLWARGQRSDLWPLALFPVFYGTAAVAFGENLGHRYLLPLYPFVYLGIGGGVVTLLRAAWAQAWPRWSRGTLGVLLGALAVWFVVSGARVYPHEIAYFNELAGGPENGYRYLVDSNLDWGQANDLQDEYVRAHPDVQDGPPANKYSPAPGRYVVSASYLQGVGIGDPYAYEWFRHREPSEVIGYSKLVYETPGTEIAWVAQCNVPRIPLGEADLALGIGQEDVRVIDFDCTQSWLIPRGHSTGIYALHYDHFEEQGRLFASLAPVDPFVASGLTSAHLAFDQPTGNDGQPFVLYELLPGDLEDSPFIGGAQVSTRGLASPELPVLLDGPLILMDVLVRREGDYLQVSTVWEVTEGPIARPFSILGHLASAEGTLIEAVDGLGVSPLALLSGDLYVHRHRFSFNPSEVVQFETGAYWLDTMERWPVIDASRTPALLFELL